MNRLIIVGNGFDLAHGLKTKYCDFLEDYWSKVIGQEYDDEFLTIRNRFPPDGCKSFKNLLNTYYDRGIHLSIDNLRYVQSGIPFIIFKNNFFKNLVEKHTDINWVDIEMEYYSSLKNILKIKLSTGDDPRAVFEEVKELNDNLTAIVNLFENYLNEEVLPIEKYNLKIRKIFENPTFNELSIENFKREFPIGIFDKYIPQVKYSKHFKATKLLNFNYTNTLDEYHDNELTSNDVIHIHGRVGNNENPINMGFGDEMDSFYSEIENKNENEFLRFMKSFKYSNNSFYKEIFDFIEQDSFQIQLLGHSCGLSDRTLLNALFEHPNCVSIKVFYHQYKSSKTGITKDNYNEIIMNISRHFNKKTLMRSKIVNKTYCEPLPQME